MSRLKDIGWYAFDDWTSEHDSWDIYEFGDTEYIYTANEELVDELIIEYIAENKNISKEQAEKIYWSKYFTADEKGLFYPKEEKINEDFGGMLHRYFYDYAKAEI